MKSQTMILQTHSGQTVKPQTHLGHIHQTLSEALSNTPDTFKIIQRHSGLSIKPRHIPDTFQTHSGHIRDTFTEHSQKPYLTSQTHSK